MFRKSQKPRRLESIQSPGRCDQREEIFLFLVHIRSNIRRGAVNFFMAIVSKAGRTSLGPNVNTFFTFLRFPPRPFRIV